MNYDFDSDFMSEEEYEKSVKNFVQQIKIKGDKSKYIDNVVRLEQMKFAYATLKKITKGKNVKISYSLFEHSKTSGSITIVGDVIEIDRSEWFARAAEFSSNIEVLPLANGQMEINFMFYGLATLV